MASCTVAEPYWASCAATSASALGYPVTIRCLAMCASLGEGVGHLGVVAHIGLGHDRDGEAEVRGGVALELHAAADRELRVVLPHVLLGRQRLHGGLLALPAGRDVEEDLRLEARHLGLVRLEEEDRRGADDLLLGRDSAVDRHADRLGLHAGLERHPG